MLVVNVQNFGDTSVVRCMGRIVAGEEVANLKRAVLCHQDSKTLVLDLSEVSTLDGSGLGLLAFFVGWTRVVGTTLKVMNPTSHVRRLLELTNLDSVLEICDWSSIPETMSHPVAVIGNASQAVVHG
jgi:anti-sigma B factor antagonist